MVTLHMKAHSPFAGLALFYVTVFASFTSFPRLLYKLAM